MTLPTFRYFAALLAFACCLAALTVIGRASGNEESPTLRVLRAVPVHTMDRKEDEPPARRDARLRVMADAIDGAAKDRVVRAALIVLARRESGLAAYVYEGRCADGPPGEQCDDGKATGPWQLHATDDGPVPESIDEQAAMAASVWRFGRKRCRRMVPDELAGAFASYGSGGKCSPSKSSKARAQETRAMVGRLW